MGAQVEKGRDWGRGFSPSLIRGLQGGQPGSPDAVRPVGIADLRAGGDSLLPYLAVAEHVGGRRQAAGIAVHVSSEMKAAEASASEGLQGRSAPSK